MTGGPTPKYFLNFSQPKTQKWWLEEYVGPALDHPEIDVSSLQAVYRCFVIYGDIRTDIGVSSSQAVYRC